MEVIEQMYLKSFWMGKRVILLLCYNIESLISNVNFLDGSWNTIKNKPYYLYVLRTFSQIRFSKNDKKVVSWHYPKLANIMVLKEKFCFLRSDSIPLWFVLIISECSKSMHDQEQVGADWQFVVVQKVAWK